MLKRQLSGRLRKAILRAFFAFSMQEVPMDPERSTRKRYSFSGTSWFKFSTTVKASSLSAFWVIKDFHPQRCQEIFNVALKIQNLIVSRIFVNIFQLNSTENIDDNFRNISIIHELNWRWKSNLNELEKIVLLDVNSPFFGKLSYWT